MKAQYRRHGASGPAERKTQRGEEGFEGSRAFFQHQPDARIVHDQIDEPQAQHHEQRELRDETRKTGRSSSQLSAQ